MEKEKIKCVCFLLLSTTNLRKNKQTQLPDCIILKFEKGGIVHDSLGIYL